MPGRMVSIVVAGGSGLVGREVLRLLARREDVRVRALVRRKGALATPPEPGGGPGAAMEVAFDYDDQGAYAELFREPASVVISCLGTTRAKAGSDEAFRTVDLTYPRRLLDAFEASLSPDTTGTFGLVSSLGAASATGLYLRTKHELEQAVRASHVRHVIVRPSLLVGERDEQRFGERLASLIMKPLATLGQDVLGLSVAYKYGPIHAAQVASALVSAVLDGTSENRILEGRELYAAPR